MIRKLSALAAALCLVMAMAGFASAQGLDAFKGKSGNIEIAGGTAHVPVMKEAAKRIMTANPAVRITVAGGGSGVGVQKAGEGLVDIGNTGRPVSDAEQAKYGLVPFPFALDGVAAVVNKANPVQELTQAQVKDIFAGKITNWKDVGGPDAAINLFTRDEASGTREVFWEKMLGKGAIVDSANVVASNGAMKTAIAGDRNALGYVSIGHIDDTLKAPRLDGVEPSQEKAVSGEYKVTRLLYMNTKGEPQGIVKSFVDYVRGPECEDAIRASGYIPVR